MNRTIKFRAWDKEKKQIREVTGISWYDEYLWVDETPMSGDRLPIENTPLMQFTGLLDKNGKEIYEGDILGVRNTNGGLTELIVDVWGSVFYNAPTFFVKHKNTEIPINSTKEFPLEIIGNIYENPELLTTPN